MISETKRKALSILGVENDLSDEDFLIYLSNSIAQLKAEKMVAIETGQDAYRLALWEIAILKSKLAKPLAYDAFFANAYGDKKAEGVK